MQRHSNVSVARLFDWSHQQQQQQQHQQDREEPISVSRLYRELAGGVGAGGSSPSLPRNVPEKARPWVPPNATTGTVTVSGSWPGGGGSHHPARVNPGRMFLRDKGMLTKGEREIIQGIYKNRGDLRKNQPCKKSSLKTHFFFLPGILSPSVHLPSDPTFSQPPPPPSPCLGDDFFVRSHHDAWLVGKPGAPSNKPSTEIPRESPRGSLMEVTAPANQGAVELARAAVPDGSGNEAAEGEHGQGHTTCIVCLREQQLLEQVQMQKQQQQQRLQKTRVPAPLPLTNSSPRMITVNDTFRPRGEPAPISSTSYPSPTREFYVQSSTALPKASSSSSGLKLLFKRQKGVRGQADPAPENLPTNFALPWIEHGYTSSESEESQSSDGRRRKLKVKVYLPTAAPETTEEDLRTRMLENRPAIAREKHLSSTDLRKPAAEGGRTGKETEREGVEEDDYDKQKRERVEDGSKTWHLHSRGYKSGGDEARQSAGRDSDSESSKASSARRVSLHTHPITVLKADEEESRQEV